MRLLLINPKAPESFWSFRWAVDSVLTPKRSLNPPLGLATLAALCPDDWTVEIVDENVESIPLAPDADLVGIGGMATQFPRQRELLEYYRARGYYVVAGGSYASLCPERYELLADTVISGEAETIWREFCADFERGIARSQYVERGIVSLEDSPTPRFDLLHLDRYLRASVQFSRGCPFQCEFCDIIVMFGRKPRTKSIDQIRRELDALRALGVRDVFFVDDNFVGNMRAARELLGFLVEYQRETRHWFTFGTEASLNVARDSGLLDLLRSAGFQWLFIGLESPDQESLEETGKLQNTREDMLTSIRRIYAHGIDVFAGFIIGFDHDTLDTFERQARFILESGIQVAMVGLLLALPKTPLYERLKREGRLAELGHDADNTGIGTNVIPARMDYAAMVDRYKALYRRLSSDRGIAHRILAKLGWLRRPIYTPNYRPSEAVKIVARFVQRGLHRADIGRSIHFLRTLGHASPRQVPLVINEWIVGIAMNDYVRRHFGGVDRVKRLPSALLARMHHKLRAYLEAGAIRLSFEHAKQHLDVSIHMGVWVDGSCLRRTAKQIRRMMARSHTTVTLHVEQLDALHAKRFRKFLRRLSAHGDRISIALADGASAVSSIVDSSVFHLILDPRNGSLAVQG